jgi:hypothetical protein
VFADLGKTLVVLGLVLLAAGAALLALGRLPWLGRLPGDFLIRRDQVTFFFPLTTCLIVSVVISVILHWLRR